MILLLAYLYFLFYCEIVPSCVTSCFSVPPSVCFTVLPVFLHSVPHLSFSRLTAAVPYPLICVCVYSLCSPSCLCQFIPSSHPHHVQCPLQCLPPCLSMVCFQFNPYGCYFVFCPWTHFGLSVFLGVCIIQLSLIKACLLFPQSCLLCVF